VLDDDITDLFDVRFDQIKLEGYDPHPAIRAKVAV
jgi:thymidylate synthase